MGYLLPTEYVQYGLTADTTDDWITMASALMDSYCRRASLLATQYVQRARITTGAQTVRLTYLPLVPSGALVAVRVRYGRPRRGESIDPFREQVAWAFGLPGSWSSLDVNTIDMDPATGELTLAENFLGLNYNEVEVTYTAGLMDIPPAVKVACAQIVKNAQAMPSVNVKSSKMDTLQMQYFSGSLLDDQVKALLRPYYAQKVG